MRIRLPRAPKIIEHPSPPVLQTDVIIQRDDGMFALGWHDDSAVFPTRNFAAAVARQQSAS